MKRDFSINEFYHVFNRGVDKRNIFIDKNDYLRFVHDLYEFNDVRPAPDFSRRGEVRGGSNRPDIKENLVNSHAFVLMPNHHHLLVEQLKEDGITLFIKKLHGGYAHAFNLRHERKGYLFQGRFKDVHIKADRQLAHLVCYIHSNPLELWKQDWKETKLNELETKEALRFLENYRWSSHLDYLGIKNFPSVINKKFLLEFFEGEEGYRKFFIDWLGQYQDNIKSIKDFMLE